jgi:hypothetical protein
MEPCGPKGWIWSFVILATSLPALGCGLSDYEKRVDVQIKSLKQFDEESKALGEPLEMPLEIDPKSSAAKSVLPVEFYVRPPKGTANKASNPEIPGPGKVPLVRYAGPAGFNVLVSTSGLARDAKDKKPKNGELLPKDFQQKVRVALSDFYAKENNGKHINWSGVSKTDQRTFSVQSAKGPTHNLNFEFQTLTDDPEAGKKPDPEKKSPPVTPGDAAKYLDFRVFFYQTGNEQAAFIYQIPSNKRADTEVNNRVDYSIRTLALGQESFNKRMEYRKRKR